MQNNLIETIVGAVVLIIAACFLIYALDSGGKSGVSGYQITAKFNRVDGLKQGSDVRMSGIKIGSVVSQNIDPQSYLAVVTFNVNDDIKLPLDSSAQISSDGLFGDKYLNLQPGADVKMVEEGGEITHTQGSVDIVSLIGRMIFSQTSQGKKNHKSKNVR